MVIKIWLRFRKKLQKALNYKIPSHNFFEIFYKCLNSNNKSIEDNMGQDSAILDRITKTSQGWHMRDLDVPIGTYVIGVSIE